jgi:tetratricopeptide (TPR) repeat protein
VLRPIVESADGQLDELAVDALALTGLAWSELDRLDEALDTLRRALTAAPKRADVRAELAGILAAAGRATEATNLLRDGLALQPDDSGTALGLAWILATSPDDSVRDGVMAVQLAERWLNAPGQARDGSRLDILACAYAEAGRFEDATQAGERAVDMATKANKPDLAEAMSARLELFKQEQPYRAR